MKIISKLSSAILISAFLIFNHLQAQTSQLPAPSNCVASHEVLTLTQSDGTMISVIGRGNLNNNWTETTDGYTVVRNSNGVYEYANNVNGNLIPSGVKANNPTVRLSAETAYLSGIAKSIKPTLNPLKASILNQVNAHLQNKTFPTSGNVRVLALLIDYPDLVNVLPKDDFDSLLMGINYRNGDGSFKAFYETSSGNQLTIDVDVKGWYRASNNFQYYAADSGYDRAADLVREAVDAAEIAGTDFSLYDNDSDGDVDGILAVHSGPGAEIGSQSGLYIWSHRWVLAGGNTGPAFYDGVNINDYMINPEVRSATNQSISGIGVFCHEFGHNLGLPDLYDTDPMNGGSEGIGNWCLMAGGAYSGNSNRPSNFSAWCKEELAWDSPLTISIGTTGIYTLDPASTTRDEIIRVNTNLSNEYFLIENRQQIGRDSDLPHHGLAIWHINTNLTNMFGNSVNADENLKGVDLEEADGLNDLDNQLNRGDAGDLFPGTSNRTTFDDNTNPSAQTYLSTNTNLEIRNITETVGGAITFDFGQVPGAPCAATTTLTAASGSFDDGSGAGFDYPNNQNCSWLIQQMSGTITLSFSAFDTEFGNDTVSVYDGVDATAPILGTFSGNAIPGNITSTGSNLFITFKSNATINAPGWDASYVSNVPGTPCSGTTTLTAASGNFSDGSGTLNYLNNLNCGWLIQPPGAASITFGLTNLATEINNDRIIVYDGPSNASPQLGSYSGTNNLNTLTSSGGSIFVEFVTNASITDQGFDAFYTSSTSTAGCSGSTTLTATSGTFSDGSMSNNYNNNQFCSWLIQPPSGQIILSFSAFATEATFDRVIVYDGVDNTAPQVGNFSGNSIPPAITSTGSSLYLEFITNGTITDQGWDASYVTTGNGCSGLTTLTASAGVFDDGSAGNNYQNNLNCTWLIQPPGATLISLDFNNFNTEAGFDFVEIFDGTNAVAPSLGRFSGNNIPATINSSGGSLFVEFTSDAFVNDAGWEISYNSTTSQCFSNLSLTSFTGNIEDGSGTANYQDNLNCSWIIQPPMATGITATFNSFDLSNPGDTLYLYEGTSSAGTLIGRFSGNTLPSPQTSTTGSMFIEFITDGSTNAAGWDLSYTSTAPFTCFGLTTLTAPTASFADGSGTMNYDNNLNCTWLIQPSNNPLTISLQMNNLALVGFGDRVTVYDGVDNTAPVIRTYFGTNAGAPVTATSGSMFIEFITNANFTGQGWDATYTTSSTYCQPTTTFTNNFGFFDDGSPNGTNYIDNTDCEWVIQVPNVTQVVNLTFFRFDTENINDTLTIYDGASVLAPILGTFSGSTLPPNVVSTTNEVLVTFKSNGSVTRDGWALQYNAINPPSCSGQTNLTAASGTFNDGSANGTNYTDNNNCSWLIQPTGAFNVDLSFNYFATQNNFDIVTVYDGATNTDPVLGTFSGNTIPAMVSSNGGSMLVEFTSNGFINANGFEASYTSSNVAILDASVDTVFINAGAGSIGQFSLNSNIPWTTSDNGTWLVASPVNGSGNSTINVLAIQPNIGPERSAEVFINSTSPMIADTVVVVQRASGRFIDANPDTLKFVGSSAPSQQFALNSNVTWNLNTVSPWISFNPSTGSNIASPSVSVMDNLTGAERTGFIVVSGNLGASNDTVWVVQDTATIIPPTATLSVNPMAITLAQPMGSSDMFTVNSTTTWQTSTPATWLDIVNPANTSDTAVVQISANSMNLNPQPRASFVAVQDAAGTLFDTVFVFQSGLIPILVGNPDTVLLGPSIGNTGSLNVLSTGSWTAIEGDPWFSLSQNSGNGASMVNLTVNASNPSTSRRSSFVALEDPINNLRDTVIVVQDTFMSSIPTLSVMPDTIRLNSSMGSNTTFDVSANVMWTTIDGNPWHTSSPNSGNGNGTVTVTASSANTGTTDRISFVEVTGVIGSILVDTVWVVQEAPAAGNISITPNNLNLNFSSGSNATASLSTNVSWTVSNPATWLTVSQLMGTSDAMLTFTANSDNLSGATRTATVTIDGIGGITTTITINQLDGSAPFFNVSTDTVFVDNPQGSTGNFDVLANMTSWTLSENTSWLLINPSSGSGLQTVTALVATRNVLGVPRYATITGSATGFPNQTVVIAQAGTTPLFEVLPDSLLIGADSSDFKTFNINSNLPSWRILKNADWLEITPDSGGFTETITARAIQSNTTSSRRSDTVSIVSPPSVPLQVIITQDTITTIGITENQFEQSFELFPNPTRGNVTIVIGEEFVNSDQLETKIYNLLGEELSITIDFTQSNRINIDLSNEAKGFYFLTIRYKDGIFTRKISLIR